MLARHKRALNETETGERMEERMSYRLPMSLTLSHTEVAGVVKQRGKGTQSIEERTRGHYGRNEED